MYVNRFTYVEYTTTYKVKLKLFAVLTVCSLVNCGDAGLLGTTAANRDVDSIVLFENDQLSQVSYCLFFVNRANSLDIKMCVIQRLHYFISHKKLMNSSSLSLSFDETKLCFLHVTLMF